MRFTDPCDDCKKKGLLCRIMHCEEVDDYHNTLDKTQWLIHLKH